MLLYKRIRFAERLAPVLLAAQHLDIIDGAFDIVDAHLPENLLQDIRADNSFFRRRRSI